MPEAVKTETTPETTETAPPATPEVEVEAQPEALAGAPAEAEAVAAAEGDAEVMAEAEAEAEAEAGATADAEAVGETEVGVESGTGTVESTGTPAAEGALPFDPSVALGWGLSLLVVIFFVYALRRARARRRAEIYGAEDAPAPALEPAVEQVPATAAEPAAAEAAPEPDAELSAKEQRRQAFLEEQARAREEAEARRQAEEEEEAAEAARQQAEEEARIAEEEARRAALLAPSGSLTESLARTRGGFLSKLGRVLGKSIDDEALEELEEILFAADIGVHTATELVEQVREAAGKGLKGEADLKGALRERITALLENEENGGLSLEVGAEGGPFVIMVVGVNGVGKTTTIGKLAGRLAAEGKKVVLAAGDTFRAAAVEQLEVWGGRVGAEVVKGSDNADPASVIFDAIEHAKAVEADVIIADTAGRLHTKIPLMEELQKIHRVMGKARAGAPDEVLLVVDATTGQNALQQTRLFKEAVSLTGIALTKLDGTAKGGVVIGIAAETALPIRYIGTGEQVGDLRPFETASFVEALFAEDLE
ncbi:MAG: signal recognition particle-docking protein FtsY [Deltaproteobacteria bacterium]|nr:signal recognition particle-docking protein FtsY [Deltaproteobacteria bacterium]